MSSMQKQLMQAQIDPSNAKQFAAYEVMPISTAYDLVEKAARYQLTWASLSMRDRSSAIKALAAAIKAHAKPIAHAITQSMGKPIKAASDEVSKTIESMVSIADMAPHWLEAQSPTGRQGRIVFRPKGLVLGVLPWNYPLWQVMRMAAPALMAGNGVLVKPAPNVWHVAKILEDILAQDDMLSAIMPILYVNHDGVHQLLHRRQVALLAFTGSAIVGSRLASVASAAIKPSVLELGGNDPALILASAEMESAIDTVLASRMNNAGQVCIATKRLIVERSCYDDACDRLKMALSSWQPADPYLPSTRIGPLANKAMYRQYRAQLAQASAMGAQLFTAHHQCPHEGFYVQPTLAFDVPEGCCILRHETFGPILPVMKAQHVDHAIDLANDSIYGLSASVFTTNDDQFIQVADRLNVGLVAHNTKSTSHPQMPFGGIKASGYGRECGQLGILHFVDSQTQILT